MKPKLLLGLALVLGGGLVGCVDKRQDHGQMQSSGLALRILIYPEQMNSLRIVPAFLVLSNGGTESIRFNKNCYPSKGIGPGNRYDVTWMPGYWTSGGGWSLEEFRQKSETLYPGQIAEWPFEIYVHTNQTLHITAHYNTLDSFPNAEELCKGAGLWIGYLDAEPVTVRFDK